MRYRKLTASGDYSFGNQQKDFYRDVPEAPAQAIRTRLRLRLGDYWLDNTAGTPWFQKIYGKTPIRQRDAEIQAVILATEGVTGIDSFSSYDTPERIYNLTCRVSTQYGSVELTEALS